MKDGESVFIRKSNRINIPEAREAVSVGGQMVKMCPAQILSFKRESRVWGEHVVKVKYIVSLTVKRTARRSSLIGGRYSILVSRLLKPNDLPVNVSFEPVS